MKNVQISFDEKLLETIDYFAPSNKSTRSAVIRDAVKNWIKAQEIKEFEDKWIESLKQNHEDTEDAEKWMDAQYWGKK